jgi:hypothetical protein
MALATAARAGDPNPTKLKAVLTTHGEAMTVMYPGAPPGFDSGFAPDSTRVYVITMTGHFAARDAALPPGVPTPTGTSETLVIDLQSRQLDVSLNSNLEPALAEAGAVMDLVGVSAGPPPPDSHHGGLKRPYGGDSSLHRLHATNPLPASERNAPSAKRLRNSLDELRPSAVHADGLLHL